MKDNDYIPPTLYPFHADDTECNPIEDWLEKAKKLREQMLFPPPPTDPDNPPQGLRPHPIPMVGWGLEKGEKLYDFYFSLKQWRYIFQNELQPLEPRRITHNYFSRVEYTETTRHMQPRACKWDDAVYIGTGTLAEVEHVPVIPGEKL